MSNISSMLEWPSSSKHGVKQIDLDASRTEGAKETGPPHLYDIGEVVLTHGLRDDSLNGCAV
eukprot:3252531-Karenia_brevis.AAC.1